MCGDKLFDCITKNIVPISTYANSIPKEIYIEYNDFENLESLYEYISNMQEDEWLSYLNNGKAFLKTSEAKHYDINSYIDVVKSTIQELEKNHDISKKKLFDIYKIRRIVFSAKLEILKYEKNKISFIKQKLLKK